MWPFDRHTALEQSGIFRGFTDWHSHILPGVDDGVHTMDEALEVLCAYEQMGVESVWLTPHVMEDMPNTPAQLRERFRELQAAYHGGVQLHLAAENMLDKLFEERLESGELLPLGERGDHLLVETSYFCPPIGLEDILQHIKSKGYFPVLAHPERYMYMSDKDYRRIKELGIEFQLNMGSLTGMYGHEVKERAEHLLKQKYYDLMGTDLHHGRFLHQSIRRSDIAAADQLKHKTK